MAMNRLQKGSVWGQFPVGTRGYPKHGFQFIADTSEPFSVYPITQEDGFESDRRLNEYLSRRS